MIGIGTHDPMMVEFEARLESGNISPLDRANAAVERADQALAILTGDGEIVPASKRAEVEARFLLVKRAAYLTASASKRKLEALANRLAENCERRALDIEGLDTARFEGLKRAEAHGDATQVKLK